MSSLPLQPDPPSEPPQKSLSLLSASITDPKLHVMEVYFCFFRSLPLHSTSNTASSPIAQMSSPQTAMAIDPAIPPPDSNSPFSELESAPHASTFHASHLSIRHRITFDPALSSPAPVQEGVLSGCFED